MTTELTEARIRLIYEWLYPELKEHEDWMLLRSDVGRHQISWANGAGVRLTRMVVERLFQPDGTPDYNTWHDEGIPKLRKTHDVTYRHGHWDLQPHSNPTKRRLAHQDPWLAVVEMLEAK